MNEDPTLVPHIQHVESDNLEDIPTEEPTEQISLTMDPENCNALDDRPDVVHIHDRMIDKICHLQDDSTSIHLEHLKICTTIEDKIFTQPFQLPSPPKGIPLHAYRMLMDLGANRSATCNKKILQNYKPIPKKTISGANKDSGDITVVGVGYIPWYTTHGQKLLVKCYYSPDLCETIISPTDVAITSKYDGLIIKADISQGRGYICFINKDDLSCYIPNSNGKRIMVSH